MTLTQNNCDKNPILILEDSEDDIAILRYIFKKQDITNPLYHCWTVEEAIDFITTQTHKIKPKLIIFDLNLPGTSGKEFLTYLRNNDAWNIIPLITLSTSNNPKDIEWCYKNGVNSYIIKPTNFEQFLNTIKQTIDYWFNVVTLAETDSNSTYSTQINKPLY